MADSFQSPISSRSPSLPIGPGAESGRARDTGQAKSDVEFQALLERVEERARKLATDAAAVEAPEQLAAAMHTARESLEDVLSLKERLLAAYREEQRRSPGGGPEVR
jgi:hypothetical protein